MREEPSSDWDRDSKKAAVVTGMGQVLIVCGVPGTQDFTHNNCHTLKVFYGPAMVLNVLACVTASSWADAHVYNPLLAA